MMQGAADTGSTGSVHNARIIKAVDVGDVVEAIGIVEQARSQAGGILADARLRAAQLMDEARIDAQAIRTQAEADAARDLAVWRAAEHGRLGAEAAATLAAEVEAVRSDLGRLEQPLVSLIEKALRLIVGDLDRSALIARLVRSGIADLKQQLGAVLRVSVADESDAKAALAALRAQDLGCPIDRIEVSTALKPGEFHLVSAGTVLDLSLEGQLERLVEALYREAERH